jgi:ABC-type glycerol-3-phosphate transport system substrate-binding protein
MRFTRFIGLSAVMLLLGCGAGCRDWRDAPQDKVVRIWSHRGTEAENAAIRDIASSFNVAHGPRGVRASIMFLSDAEFADKIAATTNAESLPDAFSVRGTQLTRLVDAGLLRALDSWFDRNEMEDFLPTVRQQGTIDGHLYSLATVESASAVFYDRELFERAEIVPPPEGRAWSWDQFLSACERLQRAGIAPLALPLNEPDEIVCTLFAPLIWSGGGDLVSDTGDYVAGVFAARENVATLRAWQQLFSKGYIVQPAAGEEPFANGQVAMELNDYGKLRGWLEAKGENLGAMLPPRRGPRIVTSSGSWGWSIAASTRDPELAALWIKWVTDLRHGVEPLVRATGALPARRSGFTLFPEYSRLPYRMFRDQLELVAQPFPATPHYDAIAKNFAHALRQIAAGARVDTQLRTAERDIQALIDRRQDRSAVAE